MFPRFLFGHHETISRFPSLSHYLFTILTFYAHRGCLYTFLYLIVIIVSHAVSFLLHLFRNPHWVLVCNYFILSHSKCPYITLCKLCTVENHLKTRTKGRAGRTLPLFSRQTRRYEGKSATEDERAGQRFTDRRRGKCQFSHSILPGRVLLTSKGIITFVLPVGGPRGQVPSSISSTNCIPSFVQSMWVCYRLIRWTTSQTFSHLLIFISVSLPSFPPPSARNS